MKKFKKPISVFLCFCLLFTAMLPAVFAAEETDYTIIDPYEGVDWENWEQYKANLHTHSTFSDGEFTLPVMVEKYCNPTNWYKGSPKGYNDFV